MLQGLHVNGKAMQGALSVADWKIRSNAGASFDG